MNTIREALVAAVRAAPEDQTARLIFADWLDEHDESALAAYVRLEAALLKLPPGSREWRAGVGQLADHSRRGHTNFGGWEYAVDTARLARKVVQLRNLDSRDEVFGARYGSHGHGYKLLPPPAEPDLFDFELRHGFGLPAEYRAFLLRVGNGPVGPDYGLNPLDLAREYPELRHPFAVSPEYAADIAASVARAQETKSWQDVVRVDDDVWERGYLELCHHGCGNYTVLVANGPLRGELWWQGDLGLVPERRDGTPVGFLAWYEEWLDRWLAPGAIQAWASRLRR